MARKNRIAAKGNNAPGNPVVVTPANAASPTHSANAAVATAAGNPPAPSAPATPAATQPAALLQPALPATPAATPAQPAQPAGMALVPLAAQMAQPAHPPRYVARAAFNLQQVITAVAPNPKRQGCGAQTAYSYYVVGHTLAACMAASAAAGYKGSHALLPANVAYDLAHGFIALGATQPATPPAATPPAPAATQPAVTA